MSAYYNEHDPFAAEWLRNLIAAGLIAPGEVDERSIEDVSPSDLRGFVQCHFFAGIGVWSYALRLAGWPDDRPVWTGSCPCQPFSAAGKRGGTADERHLWPAFFHLIGAERPPTILGEQVASKDGLAWLDTVQADLEAADYAFGPFDLCAAGFGGAHIRQRLYFVGVEHGSGDGRLERRAEPSGRSIASGCGAGGVADGFDAGPQGRLSGRPDQGREGFDGHAGRGLPAGGVADAGRIAARSGQPGSLASAAGAGESEPWQRQRLRPDVEDGASRNAPHAPLLGRNPADWLYCRDGRWRPVEPGTFPLVAKAPARVGRLRAYGNALDAEVAKEFIEAVDHALVWQELLAA